MHFIAFLRVSDNFKEFWSGFVAKGDGRGLGGGVLGDGQALGDGRAALAQFNA